MSEAVLREAQSMFRLLRAGETVESIRALIGTDSPPRWAIRIHFDVLADPETRIPQLLRRGWTHAQIHAKFGVPITLVRNISRASHTCTEFTRGRGRRFSAELKARIKAAVVAGKRPAEIARGLGISDGAASNARRALGLDSPRTYTRKATAEKMATVVDQLKKGAYWHEAARGAGINVTTALHNTAYRKGHWKKRPADEKIAQVAERVKRGERWADVARDLRVNRSTLQRWIPWRKVVKKYWSAEQIKLVKDQLRSGRRGSEIARTHGLSSSHVYRIRQDEGRGTRWSPKNSVKGFCSSTVYQPNS
jgi:transposase-like protein